MATVPSDTNPFEGFAEDASATLMACLVAEGLANEASDVLPAFERAVRAAIRAVEASPPNDLTLDFALAYLTGRIAKEQVIALQNARALVSAARTRAEHHLRAALEAERRRLAQQLPTSEPKRAESV